MAVQVYYRLRKLLGLNFSHENWTSTLRTCVPEFPPFDGHSDADFEYQDADGTLTQVIFGEDQKKRWEGMWPTYLLEVKSTVSNNTDAHMVLSPQQMRMVRNMYRAAALSTRSPHGGRVRVFDVC